MLKYKNNITKINQSRNYLDKKKIKIKQNETKNNLTLKSILKNLKKDLTYILIKTKHKLIIYYKRYLNLRKLQYIRVEFMIIISK